MGKRFALLRASMSEGMNIFRVSGRKQSKLTRIGVPIAVAILLALAMASYTDMMLEPLAEVGMEFVVLTLFVIFAAIFVLVEGVYKASGLLFNCRDDDMMLSLPIKKTTVFLIRVLKFYLFEVMVNALIMVPVMVVYGLRVEASAVFYLLSAVALIVLPILPVVISCVIGGAIAYISSTFKYKNLVQIVLTTVVLVAMLFVSYNLQDIMQVIAQNAGSINEMITRLYYPAGEYIGLVMEPTLGNFVVFVLVNVGLFVLMILALGKVYYRINSKVKVVRGGEKKREYRIKAHRPIMALVRKEAGKFASSPVFVVNAGFGLVLFVILCALLCINAEGALDFVAKTGIEINVDQVMGFMPAILFGLVFFTAMMTSITSSMISLEGKSFNILKSLPVTSTTIIMAKVLAAMAVMVPVILIGDLVMFVRFEFDIWQILMIVAASVVMPMVAELIGIIVNLKYPKMDAKDDVEVVKQSMSSMIAVFVGVGASGVMIYIIYNAFMNGINATEVIGAGLMFGVVVEAALLFYLRKWGAKDFNSINV